MTNSATRQLMEAISQEKAFDNRLKFGVPLAHFTASRVGGPADGLIEVVSAKHLVDVAQKLWEIDLPFVIIGGGSNILVSDKGIRGIVIINKARQVKFDEVSQPPQVWAESGANFGALSRQAAKRGLSGLEWAAGIPGTLGGAVIGNAGAYGADITSNLLMAEILHQDGQVEQWPVERFEYSYRSSSIKRAKHLQSQFSLKTPQEIILSATLKLETALIEQIQNRMHSYGSHRKRTQPPGASMGSMFKNPPGDYAGRLIEAAGLKGLRIGDAEISQEHANFFLNLGLASATDIKKLIDISQQTVWAKFGVQLDLEIELMGEW